MCINASKMIFRNFKRKTFSPRNAFSLIFRHFSLPLMKNVFLQVPRGGQTSNEKCLANNPLGLVSRLAHGDRALYDAIASIDCDAIEHKFSRSQCYLCLVVKTLPSMHVKANKTSRRCVCVPKGIHAAKGWDGKETTSIWTQHYVLQRSWTRLNYSISAFPQSFSFVRQFACQPDSLRSGPLDARKRFRFNLIHWNGGFSGIFSSWRILFLPAFVIARRMRIHFRTQKVLSCESSS